MGTARNLWLRWKMLRLPWRKKFFVGQDLEGNTFWEFRDPLNQGRLRRMVHRSPYLPSSHYADVQITPQWHQWLRQTRIAAPSIDEQQADVLRQTQLKINARLADERWESKARYIDKPKGRPEQMLKDDVRDDIARDSTRNNSTPTSETPSNNGSSSSSRKLPTSGMKSAVGNQSKNDDPFEKARQTGINPGTDYQPEAWTPGPNPKRR